MSKNIFFFFLNASLCMTVLLQRSVWKVEVTAAMLNIFKNVKMFVCSKSRVSKELVMNLIFSVAALNALQGGSKTRSKRKDKNCVF